MIFRRVGTAHLATVVSLPLPDDIQPVAMDDKSLCNTLAAHERNARKRA